MTWLKTKQKHNTQENLIEWQQISSMNEFGYITGCKVNVQKSNISLYISNKPRE